MGLPDQNTGNTVASEGRPSDGFDTTKPLLPASNPFKETPQTSSEQDMWSATSSVIATVTNAYQRAKDARMPHEATWLASYRAWRGEHSPEEKAAIARMKERNNVSSSVFIKITKTKATAALGQIQEIIFAGDKLPIGVEATPSPQGVAKEAFVVPQQVPIPDDVYGYNGDGQEIEPGATSKSLFAGLYNKYKSLVGSKKVMEGPSPDPKSFPQINPAEEAAQNMEQMILDQMGEGKIMSEIRKLAWECVVLGSGAIKGPMTYSNTIHTWTKEGDVINYTPKVEDTPRSNFVSIWNLYPDPDATKIENASYVIEKHLLSRQKLAELKKYNDFDANAIDRVLKNAPKRDREYWENVIRDTAATTTDERYEVLEYWGYLKKEHIENLAPKFRKQLEDVVDQAQVNVWLCGTEILRLIVNPFVPARLPYYVVPYEEHEYQLWGTSIPENMKDPQALMNGHYRMMVNNLAFAGNVILEVNEALLVPGQSNELYPGRVFRKQSGAAQKALEAIEIPNVAQSHILAFDKARQLADEATGQPSYSYGQSGVTSTTRTAAGMSMLMSAAAGNIKQVVKNFDEYLLKPLGDAYFSWNMQFNKKADIRGDLKVVAKGTAAIMQREVQSQRLLQFLQIVSGNQLLTPFANLDYILRQIATSLDLDPDKTVNDPKMAQLMADIMGSLNTGGASGAPQQPEGGTPPESGGGITGAGDENGGGGSNIGAGSAPQPGNDQFSGNV